MPKEPFSDLCSIQLTLIGISFSIFTILFSLVWGKLDNLRTISNLIKQGNRSPELMQAEHFCLSSIRKLKQMNFWTIIVCLSSICLIIVMEILKHFHFKEWIYYLICIINCLDFIGIFFLILMIFYSYFKNTNFD